MRYTLDKVDPTRGETYKLAKEFGMMLLQNCEEAVGTAPLYKDGPSLRWDERPADRAVTFPTAPKTTITPDGDIVYAEVARPKITRLEKCVVVSLFVR